MNNKLIYLLLCTTVHTSCTTFLDAVPNRSLAIPTAIEQYEQLLNPTSFYQIVPSIQEFGTDDLELSYTHWLNSDIRVRNPYIWKADIYEGNDGSGITQDWNAPYKNIYTSNIVIDGLQAMKKPVNQEMYRDVMAHALFFRAFHHYILTEIFGQPYRPASAESDLGVPLKLSSDVTEPVHRATVAATFRQITTDLTTAASYARSDYQAQNKYWVSKAAVYALLSRVYLTMHDYDRSLAYADSCLSHYSKLLDYNDLAPTYAFVFPDNTEVLFVMRISSIGGLYSNADTRVAPSLYGSYGEHDLRRQIFFKWNESMQVAEFKSFYSGNSSLFAGLATDEVYLNRMECLARLGRSDEALADLNHLRAHRFEQGYFHPLTPENTTDVLDTVLAERRRQLVLRGTRWSDLRRLNQDPRFAKELRRNLDGTTYILPPNDPRYALPIPPKEAQANHLPQNERQ